MLFKRIPPAPWIEGEEPWKEYLALVLWFGPIILWWVLR